MKNITLVSVLACCLLLGCGTDKQESSDGARQASQMDAVNKTKQIESDVLDFVDPFIGTGGHGHTFPGATVPFGMVQLSPDNLTKERWDWTSGYHYSDDTLVGFSHTHLSGTGVGDLLDILVMPFVSSYPDNTNNEVGRTHAIYQKSDEQASAGYYSVYLPNEDIKAELTATTRVGVHQYTFGEKGQPQLLIDLGFAQNYDKAVETYFRVENEQRLVGYRKSTGWAKSQPVYFVMEFNKPFTYQLYQDRKPVDGLETTSEKSEAVLSFPSALNNVLTAKVAISYVSIDGADKNLKAEAKQATFTQVKSAAQKSWRTQLNKIDIKSDNIAAMTKFYTAMYHAYIAPHTFSDVDGQYFGADWKIHQANGYTRYTLFSLWDTFRALHPLLTITNPAMVDDLVKSMMAFHDESGLLPTWDLMSNETDVMIGYHAVPVLVDAYLKGLTTVPAEKLLAASKKSALQSRFGIDLFAQYGYIPSELEVEAVSKTLEYAYDDWAIAQLAQAINHQEDYQYFSKRAQSYRMLFDQNTGFMRGKDAQGQWMKNFSPTHVDHRTTDYTEANAWQYTWFVPHDVNGLKEMFGNEQKFVEKLDALFTVSSAMEGDVSPDISGLIGQYAHGNEPCHHIPYLYAFTSQPWKGEARIREIREVMYRAEPDGLAGNDDVGQMSAWYIFSAIGFYPVNPANGEFVFGTPLFDEMTLNVGQGKVLRVKGVDNNGTNFVDNVTLNEQTIHQNHVTYEQIMVGGELVFQFNQTKQ